MEAVKQMLELAKKQDYWLYAALHLLAYTGLRRGELLALLWHMVDFKRSEIRIAASLGRRSNGLHLSKPKTTRGNRVVSLDAATLDVLRQHQEQQSLEKVELGDAYADNGIVFADPLGNWLNPMMVTRKVQSLGRKVGHPEVTPHSLRHFHCSVTLENGVNPAVTSQRVGHSNPAITMRMYAHVLPGWQQQAAGRFCPRHGRAPGGCGVSGIGRSC